MQKTRAERGITIIALVITIIVMLILVGTSVIVALNGGLFTTAKEAVNKTQLHLDKEQLLSAAIATIGNDGKVDTTKLVLPEGFTESKGIYISKSGNKFTISEDGTITEVELPTGWEVAEKPATWTSNKVIAITDQTNTIPLPNGFEISEVAKEQTVDGGLVITDGANEFVWIPVTDSSSYAEDSFGPLTGTQSTTTYVFDSQEELDYYYGTDYYNYSDFTYETDKTNVENSIKTYGGFYVGRYETTIDGNTIGVQKGKTVLTCATLLKEETNSTSGKTYYYRWWGLYKVQKDMYAQNEAVGSLMISSKQWDAIMTFTSYGSKKRATNTYTTKPDLSGSAYATDSSAFDVSKNIYDLAGNVYEFTLMAANTTRRALRGGDYNGAIAANFSNVGYPSNNFSFGRF